MIYVIKGLAFIFILKKDHLALCAFPIMYAEMR